jgi:hypothetical protein
VEGKVPIDEFVEKYRKLREAYHKDAIKVSIVGPTLPPQQPPKQPPQPPPQSPPQRWMM